MPPFTLTAPPGLSDLPDTALNAEEIAQGQHAVKILENTKFGVVRPEFFYMGRFSDGQTVARPTSKVDNLPYQASEVIYLWEIVLSADPRDGITSGAGTILYFDYQVDQKDKPDPGLVHCKTVYHVQGGQTTETQDGELSVWAIGIRGLDQLDLAAVPAWTNVSEGAFDLDSAWRTDRLKILNGSAKRSVVQAEFFDMGEFGNGNTVPQPVSDVDGFTYPYADLVFLTSWRWTSAFATGISSGPIGHTLARLEKSVVGATGVVDTTVTYRWKASTDTVTQDGRVRIFAFGFRAGVTATGTVSFTDQNANVFLPGKPPLDDDTLVAVRNSKFAALRPEFFVTTQTHGTTVPLPTSPIDSYAYARSELIYLYERSDTAAPGGIGSLLTLHGFIRQDTGAVTLNTLYFKQGGAQTSTNNGTFRVVTVALRSKQVEVDSDPNDPGGGEPGFEGDVDNDLLSGGGVLLMRNPDFESGDFQWTKGTGFTIENDPANAYDGDWVAKFVGSADAALRNSVPIAAAPGDRLMALCFIKRVSGNGTPRIRISWRDVNKVEIATSNGFGVTSPTYTRSAVSATAPAGTFFAVVECISGSPTVSQTAYFDQFGAAFFPFDLDDVDDSPTRLAPDPTYFDGSRRPTRLRRAAADLLAADIIRITEESRLNALALLNGPAEAGANITETRKALTLGVPDTRNDNELPSFYRSKGVGIYPEFKATTAMGIGSGPWGKLVTYVQWGDSTGGVIKQEFLTNTEKFRRWGNATDTAWNAWGKSFDGRNQPDLATGDILNKTLTNIADSAERFAAVEPGANRTEIRTAAAIAGQGALATLSAAAWASQVSGRPAELTDGRVASALTSAGGVVPGKFNDANVGVKVVGQSVVGPTTKNNPAAGWVLWDQEEIDVGDNTNSITLVMTLPGSSVPGTKELDGNFIGFSITSGAPPASPQVSRVGNGSLTQNNPVAGAAVNLALFVKIKTDGAFQLFNDAKISQSTLLPLAKGFVT